MRVDELEYKYKNPLDKIKSESPFKPETALILGSGLGEFADSIETCKTITTTSLPGYPQSSVQGHKGKIHFAEYKEKKLLLFQGRIHFYEGYKLSECVLPVIIAKSLGCKKIILTNAAGGINSQFKPADLMLNTSFNSILIAKELSELIGVSTVDNKTGMLNFPSEKINDVIRTAAREEKISLKEGVYFITKGPSYETPAEVQMIRKSGADAVGMSTVHEAIYAHVLGLEVAAISCITNYAAGISSMKLSHDDVIETADIVKSKFERLVKKIIELI